MLDILEDSHNERSVNVNNREYDLLLCFYRNKLLSCVFEACRPFCPGHLVSRSYLSNSGK